MDPDTNIAAEALDISRRILFIKELAKSCSVTNSFRFPYELTAITGDWTMFGFWKKYYYKIQTFVGIPQDVFRFLAL